MFLNIISSLIGLIGFLIISTTILLLRTFLSITKKIKELERDILFIDEIENKTKIEIEKEIDILVKKKNKWLIVILILIVLIIGYCNF